MKTKIIIIIFTFIFQKIMRSHKDKVIMGMSLIVGLGLIGYIAYIFMNNLQIVSNSFASYNMAVLILLLIIALFIMAMGVITIHIPRLRIIQFILGIAMILFASYVLEDNPSKYIFFRDIMSVLGAFFAIAGPTGICILDCVRKKVEESKIEIIEI